METDAADERVTLASVAEEAGVSLSTISKVLNGRADVSPATRARLEAAPRRRGYRARGGGRSESRAELIELVFHELDPIWSMEVIGGVEEVAKAHGLSVVLTVSGSRHAPDPDWIEGVMRRRPVGIVLVFSDLAPEYREQLRSRAIPFVIVDPAGDPSPDAPSVGSANWSGGLAATRHLIELGHRRIAAITGPEDMMCSLARVDGYRSAMNSAGLPIDPDWIRFGDFHVERRPRARARAARPARPADRDLRGQRPAGARRHRRGPRRGLRVPDDLSIVGYDDIPLARWMSPRLTTVHQPLRRMGEEATRLAIRLADERRRRRRRAWTSPRASWCARARRRPRGRRLAAIARRGGRRRCRVRQHGVGERSPGRPAPARRSTATIGVQPRGCGRPPRVAPMSRTALRERHVARSSGRSPARARPARRCAARAARERRQVGRHGRSAPRALVAGLERRRGRTRSSRCTGRTTDATGSCR